MSSRTLAQVLGARGEELAAEYLQNKGYAILEKNFSVHRIGEIDLIAQKGDEIVFVEVKTRTGARYGYPEEAVDYWKSKRILRAARHFLHARAKGDAYVRFDVLSVMIDERQQTHAIRHQEDIRLSCEY